MAKAIRIHDHGGPEVLSWEDLDVGAPGDGEVRLNQTAIKLNYIDVYHRSRLDLDSRPPGSSMPYQLWR